MTDYTLHPVFAYTVTALGVVLSLGSMLFIFKGRPIAGTGTEPQSITLGGIIIKTNSVTALLIFSLVTAALPLSLEFWLTLNLCSRSQSDQQNPSLRRTANGSTRPLNRTPSALPLTSKTIAEEKCESLLGKYKLYQNYEFINESGIRATTRTGTWVANSCENREDGAYVLKGDDSSTHHIEVIVNNEFEHIATTTTKYNSEVVIGKSGQLLNRTVHYDGDKPNPKMDAMDLERRGLQRYEVFIRSKLSEYVELRDQRHEFLKTKACLPALSNNNGFALLAFVCHDYTRVMKKQ